MRRIKIFTDQNQALGFSSRLQGKQIASEVETSGEKEYTLWIIEEDDVPRALEELKVFQESPQKAKVQEPIPEIKMDETGSQKPGSVMRDVIHRLSRERKRVEMKGLWTRVLVGICALVYLIAMYQRLDLLKSASPSLLLPAISPIEELFIYECPEALAWNDQLIHEYSYKTVEELKTLPPAGQELVKKIEEHPPWSGYYGEVIVKSRGQPLPPHELFQDIRRGEVWRLLTPIFLHANLLHILFNMLWIWMLGRLIEGRIGAIRYLGLVLIIGVITNTLQYLVSGPFFMGFSGVITGMAGFIWMRQIVSPLEVYPIHKGAILFLWIFILGVFLLQCLAFFLQIFNISTLDLSIANTAHLSGAVLGMILARLPIFCKTV